jgi:hypothetical protein
MWTPPAMLTHSVASVSFDLQLVQYQTATGQGRTLAVQAGIPRWTLTANLAGLRTDPFEEWRAWIARLRGAQRPFIGRDPYRARPRRYNNPGGFPGAFSGAAATWVQVVDADGTAFMVMTGLPVGMVVSPGDFIDLRWTTGGEPRRSLHRAITADTAYAPLGTVALEIEPPIQDAASAAPIVPPSAVAHFDAPGCLMRLTNETRIGEVGLLKFAPITLSAVQDLRP